MVAPVEETAPVAQVEQTPVDVKIDAKKEKKKRATKKKKSGCC